MKAQFEQIRELQEMVAELTDIVRNLCWGKHGDDLQNRSFALADRAAQAAEMPPLPPVGVSPQPRPTGRKFR